MERILKSTLMCGVWHPIISSGILKRQVHRQTVRKEGRWCDRIRSREYQFAVPSIIKQGHHKSKDWAMIRHTGNQRGHHAQRWESTCLKARNTSKSQDARDQRSRVSSPILLTSKTRNWEMMGPAIIETTQVQGTALGNWRNIHHNVVATAQTTPNFLTKKDYWAASAHTHFKTHIARPILPARYSVKPIISTPNGDNNIKWEGPVSLTDIKIVFQSFSKHPFITHFFVTANIGIVCILRTATQLTTTRVPKCPQWFFHIPRALSGSSPWCPLWIFCAPMDKSMPPNSEP